MLTQEAQKWIGKSINVIDSTHELYKQAGTVDQIILDGFDWSVDVIFPNIGKRNMKSHQIGWTLPDTTERRTETTILFGEHSIIVDKALHSIEFQNETEEHVTIVVKPLTIGQIIQKGKIRCLCSSLRAVEKNGQVSGCLHCGDASFWNLFVQPL